MIDSYYAPVYQKEINQEEDGDIIFATKPSTVATPKRKPVVTAPVITPEDAELYRKMQHAGQVGLGWLS